MMYAIIDISGKQFKVSKDSRVIVPRQTGKEGDAVTFKKVLLFDNEGTIEVGLPALKGVTVSGKILEHMKGDKVIVFKKKRRKGYRVKNGHRQQYSRVLVEKIGK